MDRRREIRGFTSMVWRSGGVAARADVRAAGRALDPAVLVNVRNHGARGDYDGTNGTDNRDAFERAIGAAAKISAPLFVPAGKYLIIEPAGSITPEIRSTDRIVLFGDGAEATLLKFESHDDATSGFYLRPAGGLVLRDLTVDGRSVVEAHAIGDGVSKEFDCPFPASASEHIWVYVNHDPKRLGVDYTTCGDLSHVRVVFSSPPPTGAPIAIDKAPFHAVFTELGDATIVGATRCRFTGATTPFVLHGGAYRFDATDCDFSVQHFSVLAGDRSGGGGAAHFRG